MWQSAYFVWLADETFPWFCSCLVSVGLVLCCGINKSTLFQCYILYALFLIADWSGFSKDWFELWVLSAKRWISWDCVDIYFVKKIHFCQKSWHVIKMSFLYLTQLILSSTFVVVMASVFCIVVIHWLVEQVATRLDCLQASVSEFGIETNCSINDRLMTCASCVENKTIWTRSWLNNFLKKQLFHAFVDLCESMFCMEN